MLALFRNLVAPLGTILMSFSFAKLTTFDVLFTCGECGLGSLGSWSYSKEWVWNLRPKCVY